MNSNASMSPALPEFSAPPQRIKSIDVARGFAMVLVVVIHVIEQISSEDLRYTLFGGILTIAAAIGAATMFMFLMGVGVTLSRSTSMQKGIVRGVQLIALAYVLNLLRGTLPTSFGLLTNLCTLEELERTTPLYVSMEIDILHFAGIALIILSIIKRISPHWLPWLFIGCGILAVCPFVYDRTTGSAVGDYFVNFLWKTEPYSHFPVFPWLCYPLFGMVFGHFFKKASNVDRFYSKAGIIGIILCAAGFYLTYWYTDFTFEDWMLGGYNEGSVHPLYVIMETGILLLSLVAWHFILKRIPWNRAFDWLTFWSREVTLLYCIQWVIIGWLVLFTPEEVGIAGSLLFMLLVFVVTYYAGIFWKKTVSFASKKQET